MMPPATRSIQRSDGETDDESFQQMLHGGRWEEEARGTDYVISPTVADCFKEGLMVSGLEGQPGARPSTLWHTQLSAAGSDSA